MKQHRNFAVISLAALHSAGACAAFPVSAGPIRAVAGTEYNVDVAVSSSMHSDVSARNNRLSAAKSTERTREHREPPPKHLVAAPGARVSSPLG